MIVCPFLNRNSCYNKDGNWYFSGWKCTIHVSNRKYLPTGLICGICTDRYAEVLGLLLVVLGLVSICPLVPLHMFAEGRCWWDAGLWITRVTSVQRSKGYGKVGSLPFLLEGKWLNYPQYYILNGHSLRAWKLMDSLSPFYKLSQEPQSQALRGSALWNGYVDYFQANCPLTLRGCPVVAQWDTIIE